MISVTSLFRTLPIYFHARCLGESRAYLERCISMFSILSLDHSLQATPQGPNPPPTRFYGARSNLKMFVFLFFLANDGHFSSFYVTSRFTHSILSLQLSRFSFAWNNILTKKNIQVKYIHSFF